MKRGKRTNEEIDADLYSTSILEDLLEVYEEICRVANGPKSTIFLS
jgi:hypothetical protein